MVDKSRFCASLATLCSLILAACATPAWADSKGACDVPVPLRQALQPASLILMGEVHGTAEAPAAFGATVCRALEQGLQVSVGLEFDRDQTAALARYLASDGGRTALDALLQSRFWSGGMQDGRKSVAMAALIERLRRWRQRHPDLEVFALYDDRGRAGELYGPASTPDAWMAARVRSEREQRPQALILTLTGNVHNRLAPGAPAMPGSASTQRQSMGMLLAGLGPRSVSLESSGGTAWICAAECGVSTLPPSAPSPDALLQPYRDLRRGDAYTSLWSLGTSTASPPAAQAFLR